MIAGTRIGPLGSMRQVVSSTLVNRSGVTGFSPSDVDDAGRRPDPAGVRGHLQRTVGCALRLAGRSVPRDVDRLATESSLKPRPLDANGKARKQHAPHRHLVNDAVEPLDVQEFEIGRLAAYLDLLTRFDLRRRNGRSQRQ